MSTQPNQEWLEKATLVTSDLTGGTDGGLLSPQQSESFLRVAIDYTTMVKEARNEFSNSPSFEVPRLSFGSRILKPGTEGTRLVDGDRVKPTTGLASLSTVLVKGEVPVSDEVFEDNIEKDRMADTIMAMVAEGVGRDIEELFWKGDTDRTGAEDTYLDLINGWIAQAQDNFPAAQKIDTDASGGPTTYDGLFAKMVESLPARYRRDYTRLRFYVPVFHRDKYQASLAARGTGLGDQAVMENMNARLAFRGIPVREVPVATGSDNVNTVSVNWERFALLVDPMNLIVGWHRRVRIEKWRDPREGATSFVVSARCDTKYGDPSAGVLAFDIPTAGLG